jgi:transcription initiation factor IIE alpha subunit
MIQVAASIVQQFETQQIMPDDVTLAANCKLPIRQVRDILFALQNAGIIIKSGDDNTGVNRYVPGLPTNVLTVQTVIDRVESSGENLLNAPDNHIFAQVSQSLEGIKESAMKSDANRLLKDLI